MTYLIFTLEINNNSNKFPLQKLTQKKFFISDFTAKLIYYQR
jgi:hypothetical protein